MKKIILLLCVSLVIIMSIATCFAYKTMTSGYESKKMNVYKSDSWPSVFNTGVNRAASDWNSCASIAVGGSFTTSNSAILKNKMYCGEYSDTWRGVYEPHISSNPKDPKHQADSFTIHININECDHDERYIQSVVAHEIGHAFGLDDSTSIFEEAIMDVFRDRYTIYKIQQDDVNGLMASWGPF